MREVRPQKTARDMSVCSIKEERLSHQIFGQQPEFLRHGRINGIGFYSAAASAFGGLCNVAILQILTALKRKVGRCGGPHRGGCTLLQGF